MGEDRAVTLRIEPVEAFGGSMRYFYDDGKGLKLDGFARNERAVFRVIRSRARRYRKLRAAEVRRDG